MNAFTQKTIYAQVGETTRKNPEAFTIVFPHWGRNYARRSNHQKKLAEAMIAAGADVVLGHGAHMFQEIEKINGQWVIYNLGNFVFNSSGRYEKKKALPFSFVGLLILRKSNKKMWLNLRLYPIMSNNLKTSYQPRFLTNEEFTSLQQHLLSWSQQKKKLLRDIRAGQDDIGHFLWLQIRSFSARP
ncbi:MAG: CapA family protein [Planctomycetes bacterium]|nr:CapA family protein [Planctomycetota bacterium]